MHPEFIIDKIQALQSAGTKNYRQGLFPSQRVHPWLRFVREDNNIFFSTLIAFTLQEALTQLDTPAQIKARKIIQAVQKNQPDYQNYQGESSYNFWPTNPSRHFPNGWFLRHWQFFAIPDDADDSCMVHLTNHFNIEQSSWLLTKLERHYPERQPPSPLTPQEYQHLKGFPTFFGKKMLREMDACVISNVLYFLMKNKLPWSPTAEDSLQFLIKVLDHGDHVLRPYNIAPNYGSTVVLLYHITRLIAAFNSARFTELSELTKHALTHIESEGLHVMEKVLLGTSATRVGLDSSPVVLPENPQHLFNSFFFFQAGMLSGLQKTWLGAFAGHPFTHLKYRCEAYYWTLLLEHILLLSYSRS